MHRISLCAASVVISAALVVGACETHVRNPPAARPVALRPTPPAPSPSPAVASPIIDLLHAVPAAVAVSSVHHGNAAELQKLVDGDVATAWNSESGDLVGAWIAFRVPDDAEVTAIELTAGHAGRTARHDLFTANHRLQNVLVFRDGALVSEVTLDLERREPQSLGVHGAGGEWLIEVLRSRSGTQPDWQETCVSELRVLGRAPGAQPGVREPEHAVGALPGGFRHGTRLADAAAEWRRGRPFGCDVRALHGEWLIRPTPDARFERWLERVRGPELAVPARLRDAVPPPGTVFLIGSAGACRAIAGPVVGYAPDFRPHLVRALSGCPALDLAALALECPEGVTVPAELRYAYPRQGDMRRLAPRGPTGDALIDRALRSLAESDPERETIEAAPTDARVAMRRAQVARFSVGSDELRSVAVHTAFFERATDPAADSACPVEEHAGTFTYLRAADGWRQFDGEKGLVHDGARIVALLSYDPTDCPGVASCTLLSISGRTPDGGFAEGRSLVWRQGGGNPSTYHPLEFGGSRSACMEF